MSMMILLLFFTETKFIEYQRHNIHTRLCSYYL